MKSVPENTMNARRRFRIRTPVLQRLGFVGLRVLLRLLSFTILRVNHFYGACAGWLLWKFDTKIRQVSRVNLRIAYPDVPLQQRERLLKESLIEFGKTITELAHVWTGSERRIRRLVAKVHGRQFVDAGLAEGRGLVILCPHMGSWELIGLYLSLEYGITSLYRPPKLEVAERYARRVRERFGAHLVPTDISGVRALRRALANNTMMGILPDQDPGESGGLYAPFFGRLARTMLLPSRLAAKTGSPMVYAFAERLPRGRGFRIHFIPASPDVSSSDDDRAVVALNRDIESLIRQNPAQYQWSYKRYKNPPAGETVPYQNEVPQRRAA